MIERFDKHSAREIRADLERAVAEVAAKHGVEAELPRSSRYSDGKLTIGGVKFKLEGAAQREFEDAKWRLGLDVEIGQEFTYQGKAYRITGLKPSRSKYPVEAERVKDGKSFKFTRGVVTA